MPEPLPFPAGLELARTTPEFDEHTVPVALLSAHRVADDVWGRLVVRVGSLRFVFEHAIDAGRTVHAGETQTIPPSVPHHVEVIGPVRFVVEFHR
jgi:ferredoxin